MYTQLLSREIAYDGSQLRPHWLLSETRQTGSGMLAFIGPANVALAEMVDWEDVLEKAPIYSPKMLHFISEIFFWDIQQSVLWQRLFIQLLQENLRSHSIDCQRRGDDLYVDQRKLSVSIATVSPVSALMHTALNIETEGTPVPTIGLNELNIDATVFAQNVLQNVQTEIEGILHACQKVRTC